MIETESSYCNQSEVSHWDSTSRGQCCSLVWIHVGAPAFQSHPLPKNAPADQGPSDLALYLCVMIYSDFTFFHFRTLHSTGTLLDYICPSFLSSPLYIIWEFFIVFILPPHLHSSLPFLPPSPCFIRLNLLHSITSDLGLKALCLHTVSR